MMTAQREPITRLEGQVRLFDAICEDLDVPRPPLRLQREVLVTTSKAETLRAADYLWKNHVAQWHLHQDSAPTINADTELRPLPSGYYISPEDLIARSIIGDPETCVERIRQYEALGADAFVLYTDVGQPQADVMRSLELFAERVLPALPRRPSRSAATPGRGPPAGRAPPARPARPFSSTRRVCRTAGPRGKARSGSRTSTAPRPTDAGRATSSTSRRPPRSAPTPTGRSTTKAVCGSSRTRAAPTAVARWSPCSADGTTRTARGSGRISGSACAISDGTSDTAVGPASPDPGS